MKCKFPYCSKIVNDSVYCEAHVKFIEALKSGNIQLSLEEKKEAKQWRIKKCGYNDFNCFKEMFRIYLETKKMWYYELNDGEKRRIEQARLQ